MAKKKKKSALIIKNSDRLTYVFPVNISLYFVYSAIRGGGGKRRIEKGGKCENRKRRRGIIKGKPEVNLVFFNGTRGTMKDFVGSKGIKIVEGKFNSQKFFSDQNVEPCIDFVVAASDWLYASWWPLCWPPSWRRSTSPWPPRTHSIIS
jgi:hypothetical protein